MSMMKSGAGLGHPVRSRTERLMAFIKGNNPVLMYEKFEVW
jgi:hypothetical protein